MDLDGRPLVDERQLDSVVLLQHFAMTGIVRIHDGPVFLQRLHLRRDDDKRYGG